jgi:hypothetical protein
VVLAGAVFTAAAVVIQPASGVALALMAGYPLSSMWLCAVDRALEHLLVADEPMAFVEEDTAKTSRSSVPSLRAR